jgi:hypothetical protein
VHFRRNRGEARSHLEGDALELLCFVATNSQAGTIALGRFSASGAAPIRVVSAGVWQAARPLGEYALLGCYVGPSFDFSEGRCEYAPCHCAAGEGFSTCRCFAQVLVYKVAESNCLYEFGIFEMRMR